MRSWNRLNRQIVECERCPRLREYCRQVAERKRRAYRDAEYWGQPVPNFGPSPARLLIVGLAPAAHGANRTGRMFTGDRSGDWLYRALHRFGFSSDAESRDRHDELQLIDCAITAICHCAPPGNKPLKDEIEHCLPWLRETIDRAQPRLVVALGQIAWNGVLVELLRRGWHVGPRPKFGHLRRSPLSEGRWLLGSYHPSQQNTFTGRLTEPMFDEVFRTARELVGPAI